MYIFSINGSVVGSTIPFKPPCVWAYFEISSEQILGDASSSDRRFSLLSIKLIGSHSIKDFYCVIASSFGGAVCVYVGVWGCVGEYVDV